MHGPISPLRVAETIETLDDFNYPSNFIGSLIIKSMLRSFHAK